MMKSMCEDWGWGRGGEGGGAVPLPLLPLVARLGARLCSLLAMARSKVASMARSKEEGRPGTIIC